MNPMNAVVTADATNVSLALLASPTGLTFLPRPRMRSICAPSNPNDNVNMRGILHPDGPAAVSIATTNLRRREIEPLPARARQRGLRRRFGAGGGGAILRRHT
ncbi:hypothetical protein [Burkholderia sp. PU8-34]